MALKRTVILMILDGWGIGQPTAANPVHNTPTPTFDYIRKYYLCGALQSAGIAVGLPWGEEGNSEVGHLTLGAGKVLYQHFPRITMAIKDGSFFKNPALLEAFEHAKNNSSTVHIAGLFGGGNVHSSYDHIIALLQLAQKVEHRKINIHLFTDGKDSSPKLGIELIKKFQHKIKKLKIGKIATISGRYYAMDRDDHWDRTEKTHTIMTGKGEAHDDIEEVFTDAYSRSGSDEFIEPTIIDKEACIRDNDSLIFFDFREDSMRQITESFINPELEHFAVEQFSNLHVVTMTRYKESFDVSVAFSPDSIGNPLGKVLADNGKIQIRIAESEKYAHVTYFFNGLKDSPFKNEFRVLVPSKNVSHHDELPEMQTQEIASRLIDGLQEGVYDFMLVNFAASDIIAHTGNYEAAQVAIRAIDRELSRIIRTVQEMNGVLLITADHGNLEQMLNPFTGEPETKHNPNSVPIYLIGNEYVKEKDIKTGRKQAEEIIGILSDVAPTILDIMNIEIPEDMTGKSVMHRLLNR